MKYRFLKYKDKKDFAFEVYSYLNAETSAIGAGEPMSFWTKRIQKVIEEYNLDKYEDISLRSVFDILYKDNDRFERTHFVRGNKKIYLYDIVNTS